MGRCSGRIDPAGGHDHGALDHVLQLAHVARPLVADQPVHASRGRRRARPADSAYFARKCSTRSGMSPRRSRSGGRLSGHHVEPVEEILAEPPVLHQRLEVAVGRREHADVHANRLAGRPRARWSRSCSTRRSLAWSSSGMSPISSRKSVPPCASSSLPEPPLLGVGERAALVAEQLRLEQRGRDGRGRNARRRAGRRAGCSGGARGPPAPCRCRTRRAAAR